MRQRSYAFAYQIDEGEFHDTGRISVTLCQSDRIDIAVKEAKESIRAVYGCSPSRLTLVQSNLMPALS